MPPFGHLGDVHAATRNDSGAARPGGRGLRRADPDSGRAGGGRPAVRIRELRRARLDHRRPYDGLRGAVPELAERPARVNNAGQPQAAKKAALAVGLGGGFTTFSAFGLETLYLLRRHEVAWALADA